MLELYYQKTQSHRIFQKKNSSNKYGQILLSTLNIRELKMDDDDEIDNDRK